MKTVSNELDTHLQQEVTSLATCWKVKRLDGVTFTFTSFNDSLAIDIGDGDGEQTYIPTSSFNRTAIENTDDLSVDNLDLTGVRILMRRIFELVYLISLLSGSSLSTMKT
jgi:hypothetical protein